MGARGLWQAVGVTVLAAVQVVGSGAAAPAQEAPGDELTLTLEVSTGLRDRQSVSYEVTGIPEVDSPRTEVWQCYDPVGAGVPVEEIEASCTLADSAIGGAPAVGGTVTVHEVHEPTPGGEVEVCSDEPADCSFVAFVRPQPGLPPGLSPAVVPIEVTPSPLVVTGVGLTEAAGAGTVDVRVAGAPGATLRLAQCVRYTDISRAESDCVPGPEIVLPAGGRAIVEMAVTATQDVDGQTFDCVFRPCEVTLFDPSGDALAGARIPGSPPSAEITLDRSSGLASGSLVHAQVESRGGDLYLAQCVASVLDGSVAPADGCAVVGQVVAPGVSGFEFRVFEEIITSPSGLTRVCADDPGGCIIALGRESGANSAYVPISFAGPAAVSLSPATGLLDGQPIDVEITGLAPGEEYLAQRCHSASDGWVGCELAEGVPPLMASDQGTVAFTVDAAQRFTGGHLFCRDRCSIGVTLSSQWAPVAHTGYTMAEGSITASPATDLVDGQTVTVSGTDLMATYPGPTTVFGPTGTWSLLQCDRAVLDDPSLYGVFVHCAAPPPGGPVEVPASTLTHELEVTATITRILGGTTDCTTTPRACVVALARLEQDSSTSLHTASLTFTPSP